MTEEKHPDSDVPFRAPAGRERVASVVDAGVKSVKEIARETGLDYGTVRRYMRELRVSRGQARPSGQPRAALPDDAAPKQVLMHAFHNACMKILESKGLPMTQQEIAKTIGVSAPFYSACICGRQGSYETIHHWVEKWSEAGMPELRIDLGPDGSISSARLRRS